MADGDGSHGVRALRVERRGFGPGQDLVPPDALGRGMAAFNATTWVGAVVGLLGAGYAFRAIGPAESFLAGAGLMVLAVALLAPIAIEARKSRPASKAAELLSDREGPP